jgi:hypothetical protein
MKTNLFIVGAAKSATTSFHDYLSQHPEINMSSIKEPNFFSREEVSNDNLYYSGAPLVKSNDDYESLFVEKDIFKIRGESSVSYLFYPGVANRLKEYNEKSKVLIFLRNPIQRAFSHYLMDFTAGYFNISFSKLIKNSELNTKAYQQTILQSFYFDQVKNYLEVFGDKKVKIIILEEIENNTKVVMKAIEDFLDIDHFNGYCFDKKNSFSYSNSRIIKFIYRSQRIKNFLRKLIDKENINGLKLFFLKGKKPIMSMESKIFLENLFQEDVKNLSNLLKKNLNFIWKIK